MKYFDVVSVKSPSLLRKKIFMLDTLAGWWFGTHFFPYIGNNNPKWLIFFRRVETTNQTIFYFPPFRTTLTQFIFWNGWLNHQSRRIRQPMITSDKQNAGQYWYPKIGNKNLMRIYRSFTGIQRGYPHPLIPGIGRGNSWPFTHEEYPPKR